MATVIDSLIITLGLDPKNFTDGQKKAAASFVRTKTEAKKTAGEIEDYGKKAAAFYTRLRNEALAFAAVLVGATGISSFVQKITTADAAAGRLARNIGLATQDLTAFQQASVRLGGSAEATGASIRGIVLEMQNLELGKGSATLTPLAQLGVDLAKFVDRATPATEKLGMIAEGLRRTREQFGPERAYALGTQLGLDEGTINLLMQGNVELQKQLDLIKRQGTATQADADAAQRLATAWHDLANVFTDTLRKGLTEVTPQLAELLKEFGTFLTAHKDDILQFFREMVLLLKDSVHWFAELVSKSEWFRAHVGLGGGAQGDRAGGAPTDQMAPSTTGEQERGQQLLRKFTGGDLTRMNQAMAFFKSKGLSHEQAAGITANLLAESNLDPLSNPDGKHRGIAQWEMVRYLQMKSFANERKLDPDKLETQLEYVYHEYKQGADKGARDFGEMLPRLTDERVVAQAYMANAERPANPGTEKFNAIAQDRRDLASAVARSRGRSFAPAPLLPPGYQEPGTSTDPSLLAAGARTAVAATAPAAPTTNNANVDVSVGQVVVNGVDTQNADSVAKGVRRGLDKYLGMPDPQQFQQGMR